MVRSPLLCFALAAALTSVAWLPLGAAHAAETVLLDFTSDHCGPCRQMEPVLKQLAAQGWTVRSVDVGREAKIAAQFHVDATPTFIVLVEGREWARLVGGTSLDQMVEMLQKANSLAAQHAATHGGSIDTPNIDLPLNRPLGGSTAASGGGSPSTPGELKEGRVVPITDPFAVRAPRSPAASGGAEKDAPGAQGAPAAGTPRLAQGAERLVAATVRLSITDPDGRSTGTGAIVDARNGMALVLTCGHLFRESKGTGSIEISLFTPGANGAEVRGKVAGELIAYDLERDLALVRFRTASPVTVAPIAPPGTQLAPGAAVTSVGCNHGENPTAWSTRITALNRYQGHPNVEAAGSPVEGRSGGGLFNAQGQLIGVCFAADHEGDEGLYSSLASIHAKLDELQMSIVYQSPGLGGAGALAGAAAPTNSVATTEPPTAVRGQEPTPPRTFPSDWPASTNGAAGPASASPQGAAAPMAAAVDAAALAGLTAEERATLEEIARRSRGAEVICIIRPQSPEGRSDVIKLSGVSPAFVRALMDSANHAAPGGASGGGTPAGVGVAPTATAAVPGPYQR
jgi:S1-C subfamily serine protease